jgi:hypothetical protein
MNDVALPIKIRWGGDPRPDITDFAEPLAIPFWFKATDQSEQNPIGTREARPSVSVL